MVPAGGVELVRVVAAELVTFASMRDPLRLAGFHMESAN